MFTRLRSSFSFTLTKAFCVIALASLACGCARRPSSPDAALKSFSGDRMLSDIRVLSSDEFQGRGPGSKGEEVTIQYLQDQFRNAGLEPGNPDGTYLQAVRLVGITADPQMKLSFGGHPLYPLARTAMDINMDGMNVHGRTRDIVMIGMGNSTLDEVVADVAHEQGRTVKPDPEPEQGHFYRSDHFSFSKEGVPAFDPDAGIDFIGKPEGWGLEMRRKYTAENYHKPSDKIQGDWDMSGAVQDAQLYFLAGFRVANSDAMPEWKPGTEFKAKRDAMLRSAATGTNPTEDKC